MADREVERTLDIRSLINVRNTVDTMTKLLFTENERLLLRNQRKSRVLDNSNSTSDVDSGS